MLGWSGRPGRTSTPRLSDGNPRGSAASFDGRSCPYPGYRTRRRSPNEPPPRASTSSRTPTSAAPPRDTRRPERAPPHPRAVFAAHIPAEPAPIAHATAFRAPGHDVTSLSHGHRSARSRSWHAASPTGPTHRGAATWDHVEPSGDPEGGIGHFAGHADPTVVAVTLRTSSPSGPPVDVTTARRRRCAVAPSCGTGGETVAGRRLPLPRSRREHLPGHVRAPPGRADVASDDPEAAGGARVGGDPPPGHRCVVTTTGITGIAVTQGTGHAVSRISSWILVARGASRRVLPVVLAVALPAAGVTGRRRRLRPVTGRAVGPPG